MSGLLIVSACPHFCDSLLMSLQPVFLVWFNAESILLFLKQDPEVAHLAAIYLRWVSLGLPGMVSVYLNGAVANFLILSLCF